MSWGPEEGGVELPSPAELRECVEAEGERTWAGRGEEYLGSGTGVAGCQLVTTP
jgi:hypothetical protein